jgi:hypothetical protein
VAEMSHSSSGRPLRKKRFTDCEELAPNAKSSSFVGRSTIAVFSPESSNRSRTTRSTRSAAVLNSEPEAEPEVGRQKH